MFLKWIYLDKALRSLRHASRELIVANGNAPQSLSDLIIAINVAIMSETATLKAKYDWQQDIVAIESCGKQFIIVFANGRRELRAE